MGEQGRGDRPRCSTWYFEGPLTALGGQEAKKFTNRKGKYLYYETFVFDYKQLIWTFPLHFFSLKDELNFLDSSSPNKEFWLLQYYFSCSFLSHCLWFCFSIMFLTFPSPAARSALFCSPFPSQFAFFFLIISVLLPIFPFLLIVLSCMLPSSDSKTLIDCLM